MAKSREQKLIDRLDKQGLNIREVEKAAILLKTTNHREYSTKPHLFEGKEHYKLGVLGDTHAGNRWTDWAFLRDIMAHFKKEKVDMVIHTGDMTDGPWQRHKNVLEQYAHGFDAQVDDFVENFPNIGMPIYMIDGNHDGWYKKGEGASVGRAIGERRDDIHYLGADEAVLKLGKLEIMLSHPDDGSAYAYSYKAQKQIESMAKMGEKMPDIILQGHYHKLFQIQFAGVNYFCTGTTCRQTPWMRGKKIAADMGAWLLNIDSNERGELAKIQSTILPYHGDTHNPAVK